MEELPTEAVSPFSRDSIMEKAISLDLSMTSSFWLL